MTETSSVHLCVGGPADGTYFSAPSGQQQVRIPQVPHPLDFVPQSTVPAQTTIAYVWYQKAYWYAGQIEFTLWVPIDQTPAETFQILLQGYRPRAK